MMRPFVWGFWAAAGAATFAVSAGVLAALVRPSSPPADRPEWSA